MDLFTFLVLFVILLVAIIVLSFAVGLTVAWLEIKRMLKERKEKIRRFNIEYPEGSVYISKTKKIKMPYGKWEWIGLDINQDYVFERVK